jgi:hypothetical protein
MYINKCQYCKSGMDTYRATMWMKASGLHFLPHEPSTITKNGECVQVTVIDGSDVYWCSVLQTDDAIVT